MEKSFTRRLACFALALAVIFAGSTVYYANREAQYERYTQAQHQQSLSQLLNSLTQLETSLEKARYLPAGAMRQTLAADVWKESQLAAAAMSALPLGDQRLEQVETYISQVGDYAYYLLRSAAYNRASEQEWAKLYTLCDNAAGLLVGIDQLKEQVDTGSAGFRQISAALASQDGVSGALRKVNDEFPEYASLIYDGPYSDHVSQRSPKALEGQARLTMEQAREKAAQLMQVSPDQVTPAYESEGQIPCYGFSCGTMSCAVAKQGGLGISLTDSRELGSGTITTQEAVASAQKFLERIGLTQMIPTYHTTYESICTINFVCNDNDITAYPDLVKVGVALDDGSIVRLDTAGYAMNHHQREPATTSVTVEQARKAVPESLTVQREHLAYIPTTGYNEVLCWEFVCQTQEGTHALLYVNCENGQIENLLLLVEEASGTLTR